MLSAPDVAVCAGVVGVGSNLKHPAKERSVRIIGNSTHQVNPLPSSLGSERGILRRRVRVVGEKYRFFHIIRMEITNEQWKPIEPIIVASTPPKDPRGRPPRDPREVLNGICYGSCGPAHHGKICPNGTRLTRHAIGGSKNGVAKGCSGALPESWSKTRMKVAKPIFDKVYDSDKLDDQLLDEQGVEMIAPHRKGRKKPNTQDGRKLRRYRCRWKVERLFAWLQHFRRLIVRYEYHVENFLAMVQLGCIKILLRFF
jgi:transposase